MDRLFQPGLINGLELKNRFVRSATWEGLADDKGNCTPALTEVLAELARGRVGLIITSHTFVRPDGRAHRGQLSLDDDSRIPALTEMAKAVHAAGSKIIVQLTHSGLRAPKELPWPVFDVNRATEAEIAELADCFAAAAGRAQKAGLDGVQLHGGHGYLINQFMSPAFNRRTDAYGGSATGPGQVLFGGSDQDPDPGRAGLPGPDQNQRPGLPGRRPGHRRHGQDLRHAGRGRAGRSRGQRR